MTLLSLFQQDDMLYKTSSFALPLHDDEHDDDNDYQHDYRLHHDNHDDGVGGVREDGEEGISMMQMVMMAK